MPLQLQNNRLKSIPYEIADIGTLEVLNVEGNPNLEMVMPTDTYNPLLYAMQRSGMNELYGAVLWWV